MGAGVEASVCVFYCRVSSCWGVLGETFHFCACIEYITSPPPPPPPPGAVLGYRIAKYGSKHFILGGFVSGVFV